MYPAAFIDAVLERLHEAPECEAFRDGRGAVTRGELFAATGRFAFGLLQQGVRSGDRLLLGLPPDRRHVVALIGALRLGVVVVPIHPKAKPREIQHVLWDAGPRVVCADTPLADLVRTCSAAVRPLDVEALSAPAPAPAPAAAAGDDEEIELAREHAGAAAKPDDRALILYTSGTTGKPKGALHTQGSLAANTAALRAAWRLGPDDRLLHCLPLHHLHGLVVGVMSCLAAGTPIVLEPGFDAERIVARLAETGATLFFGVPAMYAQLVQAAPLAPPSMRLFVSGSAPLAPALKREFEKRFGHVILERYGTTETGIALSQSPDEARPAGAVGRPLEGVATKVVPVEGAPMDENGAKGADGADEGELLVSGPSLFRGYFDDEEATAQALHDGWYRTGDLVRRAADGSFRILGRITTDLIKVKGHRVGALEVEAALAEHPRVAEAAVVGAPDAECGEVPVAFVRARDAALTADELLAHARAVLAPHQVPRRIELVDELPRTGPGKVDKKLLQARARGA